MLKKRVEYIDYLGQHRSKDLYFNLSKSDVTRMMMLETSFATKEDGTVDESQIRNGFVSRIQGVMERGNGKEIVALFDAVRRGALAPQDARAQIQPLMPERSCNGYWHGQPGLDWVQAEALATA